MFSVCVFFSLFLGMRESKVASSPGSPTNRKSLISVCGGVSTAEERGGEDWM